MGCKLFFGDGGALPPSGDGLNRLQIELAKGLDYNYYPYAVQSAFGCVTIATQGVLRTHDDLGRISPQVEENLKR